MKILSIDNVEKFEKLLKEIIEENRVKGIEIKAIYKIVYYILEIFKMQK